MPVPRLALLIVSAAFSFVAPAAAHAKTCGSFKESYRYDLTAQGGETCKHAKPIVKSFIRQNDRWTKHSADGTLADTYYTNKAYPGWRCGEGSGGGNCRRNKKMALYQTSAAVAATRSSAAKLRVTVKPTHVQPGGRVKLHVRGGTGQCRLRSPLKGGTRKIGRRLTLKVSSSEKARHITLRVVCASRTARVKLVITGRRPSAPAPPAAVPPPGTVLLNFGEGLSICKSLFPNSGTPRATLLPRHRIGLECDAPGGLRLVSYDVYARKVAWQADLSTADRFAFGDRHLVLISHVTQPASGLLGPTVTYTVSAIDLASGALAWSVPLPVGDTSYSRDSFELAEGPSGVVGHDEAVVVQYVGGTTSYDASTGQQLWHAKRTYFTTASGSYATAKTVQIDGFEENDYGTHLTGFDAESGTQTWDLRLTNGCELGRGKPTLVGTVQWGFGGIFKRCLTRHDVVTGQLLQADPYPASWQNVDGSPFGVLSWDGSRLAFFPTDNFATPIWSLPAGNTEPVAFSAQHVLVAAPSGVLLLNRADGSQVATVPGHFAQAPDAIDGLTMVEAPNGNTSVLEMDAP